LIFLLLVLLLLPLSFSFLNILIITIIFDVLVLDSPVVLLVVLLPHCLSLLL
jgi:hypothetical protein